MKLFLAIPFSSRIDKSGAVLPEYRASVESLLSALKNRGHTVYCALEYTDWKIRDVSPETEFRNDLDEIDQSDKIIVLLEEAISAGVQLELGYAYARGKQLEIYQLGEPTWSNRAFSGVAQCTLHQVKNVDEFVAAVITSS